MRNEKMHYMVSPEMMFIIGVVVDICLKDYSPTWWSQDQSS